MYNKDNDINVSIRKHVIIFFFIFIIVYYFATGMIATNTITKKINKCNSLFNQHVALTEIKDEKILKTCKSVYEKRYKEEKEDSKITQENNSIENNENTINSY